MPRFASTEPRKKTVMPNAATRRAAMMGDHVEICEEAAESGSEGPLLCAIASTGQQPRKLQPCEECSSYN